MKQISTVLKLNGLNCLLFGALFVFIPIPIIGFLSDTNPAPEVIVVAMGVILNLYGMLLLWVGNKSKPNSKLVLAIAIGDALWVGLTATLIISQTWITTINGITAAGLIAIVVGWMGLFQWQYATNAE